MAALDNKTNQESSSDDFKDQTIKHPLSKFEYDLYHEEEDVAMSVVRVKRIGMPNKGEKWKIFQDGKALWIVDGNKLTKKEREYLRTIDGVNFLINQFKEGNHSFNALKKEIKKKIKKKS